MVTSVTTGVCLVSVVTRSSLYCAYRPTPDTDPFTTGVNAVHVASGVAVFPNRTLNAMLVPVGAVPVHAALVHVTDAAASSTPDVNEADAAYGVRCSHCTAIGRPSPV